MKRYIVIGSIVLMLLIFWMYSSSNFADGKIVVLDPGHGGKYPGFQANGFTEKDIVLNVSGYVRDELERRGYKVYMTRIADAECSSRGYIEDLSCRPKLAQKVNAQAFVSIHANAFARDSAVRGIEVFYFTPFRDKELAEMVAPALSAETSFPVRFIKFGNYQVLRESLVPAVLIEMGYLTNREDAESLSSEEFQKQAAFGIANGIEAFIK